MEVKIALAGNPNSGKTTMFNALTGSAQYVGNWPGVTVEKKEGKIKGYDDVVLQDLPGIYSLSPYTMEEVVARDYLVEEEPDSIINIVDASNIERNLYLTTQILELGVPTVIALNMMDVVEKRGDKIDIAKMSDMLMCDVTEMSALKGFGAEEVAEKAAVYAQKRPKLDLPHIFCGSVEHALAHIEEAIEEKVAHEHLRWFAVKVFERDEKVLEKLDLSSEMLKHIEEHIKDCEREMDDDAESIIANERYNFVQRVVERCVTKKKKGIKMDISDKIDRIVTHRVFALPIFAAIMFLVYFVAVTTVGTLVTDFTNDILFGEWILPSVSSAMETADVAPWLSGLVSDGIIGGVGAVIGFVPQMFILFILLAILEDIGYMSRVAFIMDKIFRKFGLSGKSFIPMLISSGCGVPGIMAARTIEQERDRRMTVMTTCFIPCSAKMPIIALFAGAIFGGEWWVAPVAYFTGVAAVVISGIILKKMKAFSGKPAPFVMELPAYHAPSAKNVFRSTWQRGWSFIKRAGSLILISSVAIWFLSSFGITEAGLALVDMNDSMLAAVGGVIAPVFEPLGFGDWQSSVATVTGLAAKENVVGTFGVLYGFAEVAEDGMEMWNILASTYTGVAALSFMMFNLLCAPCIGAMGAIKAEMNSGKWTFAAIGYMTIFAYAVALIINQIGSLMLGGEFTVSSAAGIIVLGIIIYLIARKNKYGENAIKKGEN